MNDQPQTWHYGLVAQYWSEFNVASPEELAYWRQCIQRFGQPALDAGCGTGRLLVPLLAEGFDVDGSDISPDMLALCRAKAEQVAGRAPRLYPQAMHLLDLPRTYRTIYMCGAFGIGGNRQHDREALRRAYAALEPGGALVLDIYPDYPDARKWQSWATENSSRLPDPWPTEGGRRRASDGSEYELIARLAAIDPLEQTKTVQMRTRLWRNRQLVAEEEGQLKEIIYTKGELLLMLEQAGFRNVTVTAGRTGAPPTPADDRLMFVARKH